MSDQGTKDLNILKYLFNDEYIGSIQDELKIAEITKPKSYKHFKSSLTKLKTSWKHYNELKKFIINKENEEFFKMLGITDIGESIEKSIEEEKKKLNNAVVKVIEEVISIISGKKTILEPGPASLEEPASAEETAAEKIGSQYIIKVRRIVAYVEKENNTDKDTEINNLLKIGIDGSNDLLEELKEIIKEENANTNTKLGEMIKKVGVGNITKNIDWIIEEVLQAPKVFIVINDNPKIGFAKKTYDKPNEFMEYGYCIKDKAPEDEVADVQDKQFSRIFDNPFLEEGQGQGQELEDWKLSNKDISEKLAGGKDVVIFGFGASGSGKTYTLLEKSMGVKGNQYSVAQLIENKMNTLMSNDSKKWGILEDKYYVMDDKSRKTLQEDAPGMADAVRKKIPELNFNNPTDCGWKKTDERFIENITAGKAIAEHAKAGGTAEKELIGQYSFKFKDGNNKPINELQINEINVTEMHKKLKGPNCAPNKKKPLLVNGWEGEEAKPELGYYLDLVRWSPNNVASSRGPRVIKYGYYDKIKGKETHIVAKKGGKPIDNKKNGNLIIVDMPGSESVTDIIKKTYDKLNILIGDPKDGEGKVVIDKNGNVAKVWSYAGLENQGLHTILKLPYIDKNKEKEKMDYFFNYKDYETDGKSAIENSINNLRESLLKSKGDESTKESGKQSKSGEKRKPPDPVTILPTPDSIEKKIIGYAINPGDKTIHEIIKGIFNIEIYNTDALRRDVLAQKTKEQNPPLRRRGGVESKDMYKLDYELKVFIVSFLYLIRTSYYVQIILFHLRNLFLSKAGKDTDVKWMDDHDKLKNMVNEPGEQDENETPENEAIGASGGFKDDKMVIPERTDDKFKSEEGAVIKKNGLKLLFDNIIRKEEGAKSDSDPVMIVIGLINSNEAKDNDHNKYIETMRYLSKLNPNTSAGCPPEKEEWVIRDKVGDNKREWLDMKEAAKKPEGGGRKTRKKRDKRRKYTIIKRIKHKMKSNKKKTKQNKKYNSSKKCLKKSFFKTRRNR